MGEYAELGWDETERLQILRDYQILDTPAQPEFDKITRLASRSLNTPIALISLLDATRLWFQSRVNMAAGEVPREASFCEHVIRSGRTFAVPDTLADAQFASHPLVTGFPHVRFYAGTPLIAPGRHRLGTLCVLDTVPRPGGLTPSETENLEDLASLVVDLMEARRRRLILRQNHQVLDLVMQATREVIRDHDLRSGRILWNHNLRKVFGWELSPETRDRNWWLDRVHPGDRGALEDAMAAIRRRSAAKFSEEYRFQRADGSYAFVVDQGTVLRDDAGEPLRFVGSLTDISERKEVEEQIRLSEHRFRLLFERNPQPLWLYDQDTLAFLDVNEAACRLYGYSREEFLSKSLPEVTLREEQESRDSAPVLSPYRGGPHTHVRKDGTLLHVELRSFGIQEDHRRSRMVLITDVSEKKALEEQLRQAQKMEAVGQLAGGIAHDFNNILTVINGYASLALLELAPNSPLYDLVSRIESAGERAASLTRRLLTFSRKQISQPETVDLAALVRHSEALLQRVLPEVIELRITIAPGGYIIHADPSQVEQAILNLAINARDAMPEGGTLEIELSRVLVGEWVRSSSRVHEPGEYIALSVRDTGIGMTEEIQARVFEPFFTTKSPGRGTGLGLPIVHSTVAQIGGWITLKSEPGAGSEFRLMLPAAEMPAVALIGEESEREARPRTGSDRILLVEDNESLRALAQAILEKNGCLVQAMPDGDAALQLLESHSDPVDLLLTDVVLPRMDGRALAERVAQKCPGVKVLFMSGYNENVITQRDISEGLVAFLSKPFTPAGLMKKVRDVLESGAAYIPAGEGTHD